MADVSSLLQNIQSMIQPATSNTINPSNLIVNPATNKTEKQIKILVVSTHINQVNGYSKVAWNLIQQLATHPWVSLVHFGTQKMVNADLGRAYPAGVKSIDASEKDKEKTPGFAFAELPAVIQAEKPDVVFIYNDLSVVCNYVEHIRKAIDIRTFRIWAYVDLTYSAPPSSFIDILNRDVERVFCFTKGWKGVLKTSGITRPVDVLPHAASDILRPIPKDLARQQLGLPKDVFLFLSMNKNIPRKRLDLLVISFVKLMVRFPTRNIFMLIVADKGDHGGFSLFDIFAREIKLHGGTVDMFGNRLMITSKDTCYKDEDINMLYNCADACVSTAEGEGFGLCTFEPMSLGVPQIVPDTLGYSEYCTVDNSMMVKPTMRAYLPSAYGAVTGEVQWVNPEDVSKAMERYVFDDDTRKLHARLGKEKAAEFTWSGVVSVLVKRLRAVQDEDD